MLSIVSHVVSIGVQCPVFFRMTHDNWWKGEWHNEMSYAKFCPQKWKKKKKNQKEKQKQKQKQKQRDDYQLDKRQDVRYLNSWKLSN